MLLVHSEILPMWMIQLQPKRIITFKQIKQRELLKTLLALSLIFLLLFTFTRLLLFFLKDQLAKNLTIGKRRNYVLLDKIMFCDKLEVLPLEVLSIRIRYSLFFHFRLHFISL